MGEVGGLGFPERLGVLGGGGGKKGRGMELRNLRRKRKLGNRAKFLFDKQRKETEHICAGSYLVKHLEMNFRNDI